MNPMKNHLRKILCPRFGALGVLSLTLLGGLRTSAATVWLDDLDLGKTTQDWGEPAQQLLVDVSGVTILALVAGGASDRITDDHADWADAIVRVHVKNPLGEASREFKIVCGPHIGLTPAMGWNSWNCFASAVSAADPEKAAEAMVSSGLINHGWICINIDDSREVNPQHTNDLTLQGPERDADGNIPGRAGTGFQ
jgi:NPCBM/NEW2 domain-containing protein